MKRIFEWKYLLLLPLLILNMIIFGVLSLYLLREPICKGQILSSWNTVVALFFPPEDLYAPVLLEPVDLWETDTQEFKFTLTYFGDYSLCLIFDSNSNDHLSFNSDDVKFNLDFYDSEGNILFSAKSVRTTSSFLSKYGHGLFISDFSALSTPKPIPLDQTIILKLSVENNKIKSKHYKTKIMIQKNSVL